MIAHVRVPSLADKRIAGNLPPTALLPGRLALSSASQLSSSLPFPLGKGGTGLLKLHSRSHRSLIGAALLPSID